MRFIYSTNYINNTGLVDDYGRQLYQISSSTWGRKTTVHKLVEGSPPASYVPLAAIRRHNWSPDTIEWSNGTTFDAVRWLETGGIFSSSRSFTATSQQRYKWRTDGSHWVLEKADGPQVAQSHNRSLGIFGKTRHNPYLDISNDVAPDFDDIVVSYVYLKTRQETQQRRRRSAASAYAASTV
ncbi:hypothetical protein K488DRAFT_83879 [Vararia minispora EC-137]|uniref:Uncharacterized protein n=1 Tax=Vararia minispora EC-137 TaxID=1314806 RepID=A0ACB8QRS4_9AGAM|nr:hypothetical protein K488DRAFT_83879 [Vararia minispora EC-137]